MKNQKGGNILYPNKKLSVIFKDNKINNNLFTNYNNINVLSNDNIGIAGYPLVVRNKSGEYIYKILLNDTNNINNSKTYSYYEYNVLRKLNEINKSNKSLNLPILKVYNYNRYKGYEIINLLEKSDLLNKENVIPKLKSVFDNRKYSNELMGIYRMERINGNQFSEILGSLKSDEILKILLEQYYVLLKINDYYPNFLHNDLHLGNILIVKSEKYKNKIFKYHSIEYKISKSKYTPYMIDFDQSLIDGEVNPKMINDTLIKDNNFDEYYLTYKIVIECFYEITSIIKTDIDLSLIKNRYKGLKKINNKLYNSYEIMIYIYFFNLFSEFLYDENEELFVNKKGIKNDKLNDMIKLLNSINKVYNVFLMVLINYIKTRHILDMYTIKYGGNLVDILKYYQKEALVVYQFIYKSKDIPLYLSFSKHFRKYMDGKRKKTYLDNKLLLEDMFSDILI